MHIPGAGIERFDCVLFESFPCCLLSLAQETCEKSGHLQKYDMKQRRVAKRWFVLRGSELKYYRAKETFFGIGGPRGVIDLGGWCRLSRCVRPTTFQARILNALSSSAAFNIRVTL